MFLLVLLTMLCGFCFSLIGFAYKLGERRALQPLQIIAACSVLGVALFGGRAWCLEAVAPPAVWVAGVVAGITQFAAIRLVRAALRLGPLSPLWCAVMLGFVPVILYAWLFCGEALGGWNVAAMGAAGLCVVLASLVDHGPSTQPTVALGQRLEYLLLLVLILLLNSVNGMTIKYLSYHVTVTGSSLMAQHNNCYLLALYASLLCGVAIDLWLQRVALPSWATLTWVGGLASCGSLGGLFLLTRVAAFPAAWVFTISSVTSIILTALVSSRFFGERRTAPWYGAIGGGIAAILLAGIGQWLGR